MIPDERGGGQLDIVEEEQVLLLRHHDVHLDGLVGEAGRVGRHYEQSRAQLARLGVGGAPHDEHGLSLVDTGDVDLPAVQHPGVAVTRGHGRQLVRVRPRIGLGNAEGHDRRSAGDLRQPVLLLLVGAEPGDDRPADSRRDHHHQQAAAGRGELLENDGQLIQAGSAAAVLLGQVDPDEPELARLLPQLGQPAAAAGLLGEVGVAVPVAEIGHRRPQRALLIALGEVHWGSSSDLTTASTLPTCTC